MRDVILNEKNALYTLKCYFKRVKTSVILDSGILSDINFNKIYNLFSFHVKIMYIFDE
jgi:hypothetical protein